uniref:Uncharacterized protein n=1 Tax=Caenorhabditis japonica TaxID=281687 RepID=A0A8R1IH47_CAEJA
MMCSVSNLIYHQLFIHISFPKNTKKLPEKLESLDDALHYFVLVSTFRLPDSKFAESLKELSVEQNLMFRLNGEYKYRLYSKPIEQNNVPRLAWDISPVLKTFKVADKDAEIPANNLSNIKPVDDWGLLSREFQSILRCEELRLCAQGGQPVDFFHLDSPTFYHKLLDMHRGISSDLFQVDSAEHFYQSKACRVEEWNLTTTRTILQKHVYLANQLGEVVHKLKRHFVAGSENSIRLIMQKYLIEEQQLFSEYFKSLLDLISDGPGEGELRFKSIIGQFCSMKCPSSDRNQRPKCTREGCGGD